MDLMQAFQILRKRAKLTAALLLLVVVGTIGSAVILPWTYQSTGVFVLLTPKTSTSNTTNPYLALGTGLTLTTDILVLQLGDSTTAAALTAHGYTGAYQVTSPSQTGAPIVQVTANASNPATAQSTMSGVIAAAGTALNALQSDAPSNDRISAQIISETSTPTRLSSKKAKPVAVIFGVGLILTFLIPQFVERSSISRSAKRRAAKERTPEPDSAEFSESVTSHPDAPAEAPHHQPMRAPRLPTGNPQ